MNALCTTRCRGKFCLAPAHRVHEGDVRCGSCLTKNDVAFDYWRALIPYSVVLCPSRPVSSRRVASPVRLQVTLETSRCRHKAAKTSTTSSGAAVGPIIGGCTAWHGHGRAGQLTTSTTTNDIYTYILFPISFFIFEDCLLYVPMAFLGVGLHGHYAFGAWCWEFTFNIGMVWAGDMRWFGKGKKR